MRKNYIDWSEYFMGIAALSAMRSKDPSTQVGACIVDDRKRIVGVGYNGFPDGCADESFPWGKKGKDPLKLKYTYVVHAELNAILNSNSNLVGCNIYVTHFPCNECAKSIIQKGITKVIYCSLKNKETTSCLAAKKMFEEVGITVEKIECPTLNLTVEE